MSREVLVKEVVRWSGVALYSAQHGRQAQLKRHESVDHVQHMPHSSPHLPCQYGYVAVVTRIAMIAHSKCQSEDDTHDKPHVEHVVPSTAEEAWN